MLPLFRTLSSFIIEELLPFSKPISSSNECCPYFEKNHSGISAAILSNKNHLKTNSDPIWNKALLSMNAALISKTNFTKMNDALISNKCYPRMNVALTWLGTIPGKKKRTMQYL